MADIHFILSLDYQHAQSGLRVYATACGDVVQGKNLTLPTGVFAGQGDDECPKCKAVMATMPAEPMSIDVGDGSGTTAEDWDRKTTTPERANNIKGAIEKLRAKINSGDTKGIVAGRGDLRLTEVRTYKECAAALDEVHENMPQPVDEATRQRVERRDPTISDEYEIKKAERLRRRP